ncbi:MAG: hypothetical protein JOZ40_02770, partial [Methylobacteriaceae bacterium]|nr:hypothetical protein [Methylobacteriaceae bacterium]
MSPELAAFSEVNFDWVRPLQSVWEDTPYDVQELHASLAARVMESFQALQNPRSAPHRGWPIIGQAGSGKTHLIGTLRRRVWDCGGWFVLIDIVGISDFWRTVALGFTRSLNRRLPDGRSQYEAIFAAVVKNIPPGEIRAAWNRRDQATGAVRTANVFLRVLQARYPEGGLEHRDVIRALMLLGDPDTMNVAYSWLQGLDVEEEERRTLGFAGPSPQPVELVRGISWLMSLSAGTMIALDQIDAIVTEANLRAGSAFEAIDDNERKARSILQLLAGGVIDLFDVTNRSLIVTACLQPTWNVFERMAPHAFRHRFVTAPLVLESVKSTQHVATLVQQRLDESVYGHHPEYRRYPTWPFSPEAIASAEGLSPRVILMRCDEFRRRSLDSGEIHECRSLAEDGPIVRKSDDHHLDSIFETTRQAVDIDELGDHEEGRMADLLRGVLSIYAQ